MKKQLLTTVGWIILFAALAANLVAQSQPVPPTITAISPTGATVNDPDTTVTITGTGFQANGDTFIGSRVQFIPPGGGSIILAPASVTATTLSVVIPAARLVTAGTAAIIVNNVSDGTSSNAVPFVISLLPTITSLQLNPTPVNGVRALNVFGTNFEAGDVIYFGAPGCTAIVCLQSINTTFVSATGLAGSLPASFIPVPGIYNVFVLNPAGRLSNVSPLNVGFFISGLTPATVSQNAPPPVLTVTAESGLSSGYVIYFNGNPLPTTIDSAFQAHAQLTAPNVATLGSFPVTIQNVSAGVSSNTLQFNVVQSISPSITSINPPAVTAGDAATYLVIQGGNFQPDGVGYTGARVIFTAPGGSPQTLVPGTNAGGIITLTLAANLLANPGNATIAISNVSDGKTSTPVTLTIVPRATITSLQLNPTAAGGTTALNVFGLNFASTDKVLIGPPGCVLPTCMTPLNTTFNGATNLSASIPGSIINNPGNYNVFVLNYLGALSAPSPLTIALTITRLNPLSVAQNGGPITLNVTAVGGMNNTSVIVFNGNPLATTLDSPTQVHATLQGANLATIGVFPVLVQNGTFTSNTLNFVVSSPQPPAITLINPNGATAGDSNTILTITGTNFAQDVSGGYIGARVNFTAPGASAAQVLVPTSNNGTTLTVTIPSALLATAGAAQISVSNVSDGRTTAASAFTILARALITSIQLNPSPAAPSIAINVLGSNYNSDDVIYIGPATCTTPSCAQAIPTAFNSATNLSGNIPGSIAQNTGNYNVFVVNRYSGYSLPFAFTISLNLTTLTPATAVQNAGPVTLNVTALGGFNSSSVIYFNGQALSTTLDSATQVHATLQGASLATIGVFPVTVKNGTITSNALNFTVVSGQPPVITLVTPNGATAGDGNTTLTITGTNFAQDIASSYTGARVNFTAPGASAAQVLVPTSNNGTTLTVTVPTALLATAGVAQISVTNVTDGKTSPSSAFTILARALITSVQLNPTAAGSSTAINVFGSNYNSDDVIYIGPATCTTPSCAQAINTTYNSATNLAGSIPGSIAQTPGSYNIFVVNRFGGYSLPFAFNISISLTSLSPATAVQNAGPVTLNVISLGGFNNTSVIYFNGQALTTTLDSATQVHATLQGAALATIGAFPVTVKNGTITSNALNFNVVSGQTPVITLVTPNGATAGDLNTTVTITGTNFAQDIATTYTGARVNFTAPGASAAQVLVPTSNNGTTLTVTVPTALLATAGAAQISVTNVTDGKTSPAAAFTILARGLITSVQSNPSPAAPSIAINVLGSNYNSDDVIYIGPATCTTPSCAQAIPTTFNSATNLSGNIPGSIAQNTGNYNIFVVNRYSGYSLPFAFTISLSLTTLTPATAVQNAGPVTLNVTALGGFNNTSVIYFNGQALTTTLDSATQVHATLQGASLATIGVFPVTVKNGTVTSNALNFTVVSGQPPVITLVTPNGATAGDNSTTVTITGTNFALDIATSYTGARVNFTAAGSTTAQVLVPSANTGTSLTVTIPANLLTTAGAAAISVTNVTDGKTSASSTFTILPKPVITSLQLNPTPVGGTSALNVFGSSYNTDDRIFIGPASCTTLSCAQALNTTFNSPTGLGGSLPGSFIPTPGNYNVFVVNRYGGISLPFTLAVNLTILNINPSSALQGSTPPVLTVNAVGGLTNSAVVFFNGTARTTTVTSVTQAQITLTTADLATVGTFPVYIQQGSFTSNSVNFTVYSPNSPLISSISPSGAIAGSFDTIVTITGANFQQDGTGYTGARVLFTPPGRPALTLTPLTNTGTTIRVIVPQAALVNGGVATIVVSNVSGNGQSPAFNFIIRSLPVISQLTPNPTGAGLTVALVVQGANYFNDDTVMIGAPGCVTLDCLQPLNTTFNSSNTLGASLPGTLIPTQGVYNVFVKTSFGSLSAVSPLTVTLGIISLNPNVTTQLAAPPTVLITSTGGFQSGATAYFAGQPVATTVLSDTQLNATLSAANVAVAGTFPMRVQNPNQQPSNSLAFTVLAAGQVSAVTPNTTFAGTGPLTIQVSGANFQSTDVVIFGTSVLNTTFNGPQSLSAVIPAALLTNAGNFQVAVQNIQGVVYNAVNFSVTLQITGLTPAFVTAGGPAFTLTATLTGGVTANTVLSYGGTALQTVSYTPTTISATVPAALITTAATPAVIATDGTNQSNTVNHLVLGAVTITSISPNFVTAGANSLTITVTGIGFDSGSSVTANGTAVLTTYVNSTTLTAQVPGTLLTAPGTVQIGVTDSRNRTSNQVPLSVIAPLTLTRVSPNFAVAGSAALTITVTGTGFDSSTIISWLNCDCPSINLATTFVSATQVTAVIPATLLASSTQASLFATDSRRRTAGPIPFYVVSSLSISRLNPASGITGTPVNLTITGSGFAPSSGAGANVNFGASTTPATVVNDTTITVTIPASANSVSGGVLVSVSLTDGRVSNTLSFSSQPPASTQPVITSISPTDVLPNAGPTTLTVSGYNFVAPSAGTPGSGGTAGTPASVGSIVKIDGVTLPTTFLSNSLLTATLPNFPTGAGHFIQVINPNGQASNLVLLNVGGTTVRPVTLTSLTPNSAPQGSPALTITLVGSGFQAGAQVLFAGYLIPTQVISDTQATAIVPPNLLATPGGVPVQLLNSNGTLAPALLFNVIPARPLISSLFPNSISAGAGQFTLLVNGDGFKPGATVSFGGVAVTTTPSGTTQLTATIPASLVKTAGLVPVIVTNTDNMASDPATFTVLPFSLLSISPSSANAGDAGFTMTLSGVGFLPGATANFNGSGLVTTFVNSSSLTAVVPSSLLTTAGTFPITVSNPDGGFAGPVNFTVKAAITLTTIAPATATANTKQVTITATGSGFAPGATIQFNGTAITTNAGSSTTLTGTIPGSLLTATGSFPVTVVNPNGDTSNSLNFTVTTALPLPTITSVSPNTATVGSAAITISVTGTNFVQGSTVSVGGTNSSTTFVSSTQLSAVVSAGQLSQAGVFSVVVTNPDGNASNSVDFTVLTPLSITSLSPAALPAGGPDATLVVIGSGIVNGAKVQVGGATLTPSATSPTQITVTVPANVTATSGVLNVTVTNPDGKVSNALTLTVVGLPTININATVAAGAANQVTLTLDNPAPADLTGTLVMSFVANAANTPANYVDPAMQFAAGGTSVNFTIAKGAKTATIPGNGAFSPGTVAGTLTFTLTKLLSGIDNVLSTPPPSKSFTIDRAAPSITANTVKIINGSSGGFTVELIGFTTTREITRVNITFTSTASIDGGGSVSVDVSSAFNTYFNSATGLANGGAFKLDLPFTISGGDASVVTAVSVSISNSVATSAAVTGGR